MQINLLLLPEELLRTPERLHYFHFCLGKKLSHPYHVSLANHQGKAYMFLPQIYKIP